MIKREFVVMMEQGLHARPASVLVRTCQKWACNIMLNTEEKAGNSKSILGVLSCGLKCGDRVVVTAEGKDEDKAMRSIEALFKSGFQE